MSISHMLSMPTTNTWEESIALIKIYPRIGSLSAPRSGGGRCFIPCQCICQQCMDAVQTVQRNSTYWSSHGALSMRISRSIRSVPTRMVASAASPTFRRTRECCTRCDSTGWTTPLKASQSSEDVASVARRCRASVRSVVLPFISIASLRFIEQTVIARSLGHNYSIIILSHVKNCNIL